MSAPGIGKLVDRLREQERNLGIGNGTRDLLHEARRCIEQHQANDAQRTREWLPPYGVAFTTLEKRVGALERVLTMAIANAGPAKGSPADKASASTPEPVKALSDAALMASDPVAYVTRKRAEMEAARWAADAAKPKRKAAAKPVKRAASKPSRKAARI